LVAASPLRDLRDHRAMILSVSHGNSEISPE
jgi:hypothetical protein